MDIRKRIRPFYYLNVIYDGIKKKQPPLCMGNDKTRKFVFQSATVIIKRNKKIYIVSKQVHDWTAFSTPESRQFLPMKVVSNAR